MPNSIRQLGIFILNWQQPQKTINCIQSILNHNIPPYQVTIIDNNSQDGSPIVFKKKLPQIELVNLNQNYGYAQAFNQGIKLSRNYSQPWYLVCNNDMFFKKNAIFHLWQTANNLGPGNIYQPYILVPKTNNRIFSAGLNSWIPGPHQLRHFGKKWTQTLKIETTPYLSGCCFLISSQLFWQLNGFRRTDFFMYAEDIDLGIRAQRQGAKLYSVPPAAIYHHFQGSTKHYSPLSRYYIARNTPQLIKEYSQNRLADYLNFYFWGIIEVMILGISFKWTALKAFLDGTRDFVRGRFGKNTNY